MYNFDEVIAKSIELNNAINKLNEESKVLNSIVAEKRMAKKQDIMDSLQKYIDIMIKLDINEIWFKTSGIMYYNGLNRRLGIRIKRWDKGVQIDLGCLSTVMNGFYTFHSIGYVCAGLRKEEILNGFCEKWDSIKKDIDIFFAEAIEEILEARKEKAIKERECAIGSLTAISR